MSIIFYEHPLFRYILILTTNVPGPDEGGDFSTNGQSKNKFQTYKKASYKARIHHFCQTDVIGVPFFGYYVERWKVSSFAILAFYGWLVRIANALALALALNNINFCCLFEICP
ncbi:hypothetical protein [Flavobacterium sp. JP2137]|uniref:hypothetical protein n=1 Tax=Flavobacterium sp. JP2137 TaxID=3414510 RepID=UPI003D2FC0B3